MDETRALLTEQLRRYPRSEAQDLLKALYQSAMGCGHFVDEGRGMALLRSELEALPPFSGQLVEPLGTRFCRVHLEAVRRGLAPGTLLRLFVLTGEYRGDREELLAAAERFRRLCETGELPLDPAPVAALLTRWRAEGCPSLHHSDAFRAAYSPAYRVLEGRFGRALELLTAIDRALRSRGRVTVAIEGGSASGKSTLAGWLARVYDCNVFHMDDFFLRPEQRSPERFAEPGGNVDYERFRAEVAEPLLAGGEFSYRPYDCGSGTLSEPVRVTPKPLSVIEGAYSMHPTLADGWDVSVFLRVPPEEQRGRILRRNGAELQRRFIDEWIPLETRYFEATGAEARCGLSLEA